MNTMKLPIKGMHCRSCELLLEQKLGGVRHVSAVKVSQAKAEADIAYEGQAPSRADLERAVKEAGYAVGSVESVPWLSGSFADYRELGIAAVILLVLYGAGSAFGLTDISAASNGVTYSFALVIGLVAGVSTCMAIVGGLVLAISARHAELHPEATAWQKFRPHLYFNLGRIAGYGVLGGALGALGSVFRLSSTVQSLLAIVIGVVMVLLGLKLTGISPRLSQTSLTLPSWIAKALGVSAHPTEYSPRTAVTTGVLTFFLPCGFTQAMQIAAIGSGSDVTGGFIMALFALGNAPAL